MSDNTKTTNVLINYVYRWFQNFDLEQASATMGEYLVTSVTYRVLPVRARLHQVSAWVNMQWRLWHSSHWSQCKQIESVQNGVATVTTFFSKRAMSQLSSQLWLWVDAGAWCKRAFINFCEKESEGNWHPPEAMIYDDHCDRVRWCLCKFLLPHHHVLHKNEHER